MLSLIVRVNTAPATDARLGVGSASVTVTAELKATDRYFVDKFPMFFSPESSSRAPCRLFR
jgi:hypothetical protein